ncbi:unnamed protein product [Wickerhamomyces anomalus]
MKIQSQNNWNNNTKESKKKRAYNPNLESISRDVTSYLSKSPTALQTVDNITQAMKDLSQYKLEKVEKLQIINSAPYSLVNLYSIVEECDQRFSEQEIEDILQIVQTHFPQQEVDEEEEDQEMEE